MSGSAEADHSNNTKWQLGSVSAHYEANGLNPGTVSPGTGDHGGVSYGIYQLSSRTGTVREYLDQSAYGPKFEGLEPATNPFNSRWKNTAQTDAGFGPDQRDFIAKSHFHPCVDALKADDVDLSQRGIAVQEALWSTSVQYRGMTTKLFEGALQDKLGQNYKQEIDKISDRDIVSAVQDYKMKHVDENFRHSSERQREGIRNRIPREKQDLVDLAEGRTPDYGQASRYTVSSHPSAETRQVQDKLNALGYTDGRRRPIAVDGIDGHATRAAIAAFQHDNHLAPDGVAGPRTQAALDAHLHQGRTAPASAPQAATEPHAATTADLNARSYWDALAERGRAIAQQNQAAGQATAATTAPRRSMG